ncbi:MAG: NAD(P)/FAD-dependent oxidoreductase [Bacilli bacterium]|nr:NAD(P)/FAD-dependent oxidoreductase [Bacilli bacterium]
MIRLRQVKVSLDNRDKLLKKVANILHINETDIKEYKIIKESIDARNKRNILLTYEIDILVDNEEALLNKYKSNDIFISPSEEFIFEITGTKKLNNRPIIVGSGPAGLFCAYLLSEHGYNPVVIERGECVEERVKSIETFWNKGKLNINSNVQFGEGGAGTFSDGKLNTLVKDKEFIGKKVFEIFVENGAPKEIMYLNKPHIGTDLLRQVIINMRQKIISMGGEFRYNSCLTDIEIINNEIKFIEINNSQKVECDNLILATGHSARDTFKMLYDKGINMESKPFAVGLRIEHPQEMINKSQYGISYHPYLGQASYKLTYKASDGRGVYSFCMCPGGYVVNASSEEGHLVVNGMSNHNRDSKNANSAIVVTVSPKDFGNNPMDGIEYQRRLESLAYQLGNGKIPLQLYKDFCDNKKSTTLGSVKAITKGDYTLSNLNEILPDYISSSIKEAIPIFDKKIQGFARGDALLLGIESRTSSPIKIIRNDNYESNVLGVYPIGEGAGYAGGITTSAIDGVKMALKFAKIYNND